VSPVVATAADTVLALPPIVETAAITAGALSGALHATRRDLDAIGIVLVAMCTAVGGGAVRDAILQVGVPWFLVTPSVIPVATLAAVVGYFFASAARSWVPAMVLLDSLLIGAWVVIGAEKTLLTGLSSTTAVFLGVITAVGGGLLRDVLCRETPAVFQPGQYYALAALVAAVVLVVALDLGASVVLAQALAIGTATSLRWLSMRYDLRTPTPSGVSARLGLPPPA
jgi:uncharacterized membrane protein YeiH